MFEFKIPDPGLNFYPCLKGGPGCRKRGKREAAQNRETVHVHFFGDEMQIVYRIATLVKCV